MKIQTIAWLIPAVLILQACSADPALGQPRRIQANPKAVPVLQPDGTKANLYLRGDEKRHWYEDGEGYLVLEVPRKYVYALRGPQGELVPTSIEVGTVDPAACGLVPGVRPSAAALERLRQRKARVDGGGVKKISANPKPVQVRAGGKEVILQLRGDERYHWYEDSEGFTVLELARRYVYALRGPDGKLIPTPLLVGKVKPGACGLSKATGAGEAR